MAERINEKRPLAGDREHLTRRDEMAGVRLQEVQSCGCPCRESCCLDKLDSLLGAGAGGLAPRRPPGRPATCPAERWAPGQQREQKWVCMRLGPNDTKLSHPQEIRGPW